jgi:hypothetical protein
MIKSNGINGGRGVRISENIVFDLEGRCSIHLSYGRNPRNISGWLASAQARLSHGGRAIPFTICDCRLQISKQFPPFQFSGSFAAC